MKTWIKALILLCIAAATALCGVLASAKKTDTAASSGNSDADYVGDEQMMVSKQSTKTFEATVKELDSRGLVKLAATSDDEMSALLGGEFSLGWADEFRHSEGIEVGDTVEITVPSEVSILEIYPAILEDVSSVRLPGDDSEYYNTYRHFEIIYDEDTQTETSYLCTVGKDGKYYDENGSEVVPQD